MAYTPNIVINKKQLGQFALTSKRPKSEFEAFKYLVKAHYECDVMKFGENELILIMPELSGLNSDVRKFLVKYEIEHQLSN